MVSSGGYRNSCSVLSRCTFEWTTFRWFNRQRIRIELSGADAHDPPVELHEQQLNFPEHRFADWACEEPGEAASETNLNVPHDSPVAYRRNSVQASSSRRVLPEIALNEVFIGESLSSR